MCTVWTSNVVPAEIVRRPPGNPQRGVPGGSPDFLAKSLVIPPIIYTKFKLKFMSDKLEFCIYSPGPYPAELYFLFDQGGLRIFWLNHWQTQTKFSKTIFFIFFFENFVWICQWFSQKIRRPSAGGLRGVSGQFPPGQHCWSTRYILQ